MILLILFGMPVISDSLLLALASRLPMTPLAETPLARHGWFPRVQKVILAGATTLQRPIGCELSRPEFANLDTIRLH